MIYYNHRQPLGTMHHTHRPSLTSTELYYHIPLRLFYVPITSQHTEPAYILILTARSAHITPPARRRSASRAYARENTLPSSAKWGPFRCSFSERTRRCSQSDPTYRPYYPPIYIPLLMYHAPQCLPILYHYIFRNTSYI